MGGGKLEAWACDGGKKPHRLWRTTDKAAFSILLHDGKMHPSLKPLCIPASAK